MTEETNPEVPAVGEEEVAATRLSEATWAEITELYELGKFRVTELADKYGISRQALAKRFKAKGVAYGTRAAEVAAAAAAAALTATHQAAAAALAERFNDKRLDWIEETRVQGYKALKQADILAKRIVAEAHKNMKAMGTIDDDLKAVQRFQKILVENTLTRLDILNSDDIIDEDDLPQIHFEDLTDEDIIKHHRDNDLIDEDTDTEALLAELADYTVAE